jgi:DNA topoisomerase-1
MNLGTDPSSGLDVMLMRGPYGYYVQLGPTDPKAKTKPKRAAWPKNAPVATAELELALRLLALPRQLGNHTQTDKQVEASIGPFVRT